MKCPICATETQAKREGTPYWMCPGCGAWYQDPMPPKIWHGAHETWVGQPMPEGEKQANAALADYLCTVVQPGIPNSRTSLDVGCGYPYLAHCLAERGFRAFASDGDTRELERGIRDGLRCRRSPGLDGNNLFAISDPWGVHDDSTLDLVTFVHVFEHIYDPRAAFAKLRAKITPNGSVFIRMPDHTVPGYERDLSDGHYSIHPFYYCLASIAELCAQSGWFRIVHVSELRPGQRDIVMKPL